MKTFSHISICLCAIALVITSCGRGTNKQGGKYTYSYITYGTDAYKDVAFEAASDTLAYIWAQEKFNADQKAVYAELNMSDMDKWVSFRIPKDFIVKKGNREIALEDVKSPSMLEDETLAYKTAYFGMSRDEIKALPEFVEWLLKTRDDSYHGNTGKDMPYQTNLLYYRVEIGDYAYDVTMEFDHDNKLMQIDFDTAGSTILGSSKEARAQLLHLIRSRYGMSDQDRLKGSFDDSKERYEWGIGKKMIIISTHPGSLSSDIHLRMFSTPMIIANSSYYSMEAKNKGIDKPGSNAIEINDF